MRTRDPLRTFTFLNASRRIKPGEPPSKYPPPRQRFLSTPAKQSPPNFAFAFDIDGVLLRSSKPIPGASKALSLLQRNRIPFILLTNGGGKHDEERVEELSRRLEVPLDTTMFVQSHTPFADFVETFNGGKGLKDQCIMVVGGDAGKCREVAERYGYTNVITPGDIYASNPHIWPFSSNFLPYYRTFAKPLPRPIDPSSPSSSLKVDAIFVYNDPRDWGLDSQIMLDVLLSSGGVLGTVSPKNNDGRLPNRGYLQDGQPPLYYSNPDLWWAAGYPLSRLGQGGFREAFDGLWTAVAGGPRQGVRLDKVIMGKPFQATYEFAEKKLVKHRDHLVGSGGKPHSPPMASPPPRALSTVYMIGDNPDSDIRGANTFRSPIGAQWLSILVRSGVYDAGSVPSWEPTMYADDVWHAVQCALKHSRWEGMN